MPTWWQEEEVLEEISLQIKKTGLRALARKKQISAPYLSDVQHKRRAISETIAAKFGFKRIVVRNVVFERVK